MSNEIIYNRNLIVYEIVYIPWENNTEGKPWKYIGSTKKDLSVYFGQIRSKKWKNFWISEVEKNPHNFRKTVLCQCITNDAKDLLALELTIQKEVDVVKNANYFNEQFAQINGYFGRNVSGELNPMYGVKRQKEWKENSKIRQKSVLSKPQTRKKMSAQQKIAQNLPSVAANKSIKQQNVWKENRGKISNSIATQYKPTSHTYIDTNVHLKDRKQLFSYCAQKQYSPTFAVAVKTEKELQIIKKLQSYGLFKTHSKKFIAYIITDKRYLAENLPSENQTMTININKQFEIIKTLLEELIDHQSVKLLQHIGLYQEIK